MEIHPLRIPKASQLLNIDELHPLFKSKATALLNYHEHCVRGDGEEIRKFLHRIKEIFEKRWPDDMEGTAEGDRAAKRQAQGSQRRQSTLIILYEDFAQGTYNEKPKNT